MAKGLIITDNVKQLIAQVYLEHPDWRAKEILYEISRHLYSKSPGLSAIQKELAKIRRNDSERSPESKGLDQPWSLGTLDMKPEYELPPEIIPVVLDLKRARDLQKKKIDPKLVAEVNREFRVEGLVELLGWVVKFERVPQPFSVREAKWIARIFYILKDRVSIEELAWWVRHYASYERACELANVKCDTSGLDIGLLNRRYWLDLLRR